MNSPPILKLVLDAQGVTFNAPLLSFFKMYAKKAGISEKDLIFRWHKNVRKLAWLGQNSDDQLWRELIGDKVDGTKISQELEEHFCRGPVADSLKNWSQLVPIWLLSNHRSHWIIPRLKRFQLDKYFEKLLISDQTGFIKPQPESFLQVACDNIPRNQILIVDDRIQNIDAAASLGFRTIWANNNTDWVAEIENQITKIK